jgi:hypothetical protein
MKLGKFTWWDVVLGLANLAFVVYLVCTHNWALLVGFTIVHCRIDRLIKRIEKGK